MSTERQLSFLDPPVHSEEHVVAFSEPEISAETSPKEKATPLSTGKKYTWELDDPTGPQLSDISHKCRILGIPELLEETVSNKGEAMRLQNSLMRQLNSRNAQLKEQRRLKRLNHSGH